MGDLRENTFTEIWHSARYREFRRMALNESKRHPYFAPIGCHRTCDNLMHNEEVHRRLRELSNQEKEQLRRFIVEEES